MVFSIRVAVTGRDGHAGRRSRRFAVRGRRPPLPRRTALRTRGGGSTPPRPGRGAPVRRRPRHRQPPPRKTRPRREDHLIGARMPIT